MTYPGVVATPGLAPDAAVAVDLIEWIGIDGWPRLSEGLTHSQPYLRLSDAAFFEDLQAWLASRAGDQPSFVQSAVANLRRILDDLLLVVHYDMVPRGEALWVRKWYHGAHGGTSSPREVEFFQMHTLLIQNLAAELTRAINLVLARVRQADDRVLQTSALTLVDTGSPDAPMHPAQYTPEEQTLPQPYRVGAESACAWEHHAARALIWTTTGTPLVGQRACRISRKATDLLLADDARYSGRGGRGVVRRQGEGPGRAVRPY